MIATILILAAATGIVFWCMWHWEEWDADCNGEAKQRSQGLK